MSFFKIWSDEMAGHLLATVNPEAADAIGREPTPARAETRPGIGTIVKFYPAPGFAPGGRTEFCMLVTKWTNDGRAGGVVIFDANDFRDVDGVWQYSETNKFPAWDWLEPSRLRADDGPPRPLFQDVRAEALFAELEQRLRDHVAWANGFARGISERIEKLEMCEQMDKRAINTLDARVTLNLETLGTVIDRVNAIEARPAVQPGDELSDTIHDAIVDLGNRIKEIEKEFGLGEFRAELKPRRK
jgi:hypothetical protein